MLDKAWSYFLYLYGLFYQVFAPCSVHQLLPYLGKRYFKAEELANDALLLIGYLHIGDDCTKQTWTYGLHPERDDMKLQGTGPPSHRIPSPFGSILQYVDLVLCHSMITTVAAPSTFNITNMCCSYGYVCWGWLYFCCLFVYFCLGSLCFPIDCLCLGFCDDCWFLFSCF
uniref:Uncharacterized protein n=1 Tax=Sander lucioperca TaxID=283035 RepID=A0A8C9X6N2_SANLU